MDKEKRGYIAAMTDRSGYIGTPISRKDDQIKRIKPEISITSKNHNIILFISECLKKSNIRHSIKEKKAFKSGLAYSSWQIQIVAFDSLKEFLITIGPQMIEKERINILSEFLKERESKAKGIRYSEKEIQLAESLGTLNKIHKKLR
jgi:hypothetical protein